MLHSSEKGFEHDFPIKPCVNLEADGLSLNDSVFVIHVDEIVWIMFKLVCGNIYSGKENKKQC